MAGSNLGLSLDALEQALEECTLVLRATRRIERGEGMTQAETAAFLNAIDKSDRVWTERIVRWYEKKGIEKLKLDMSK